MSAALSRPLPGPGDAETWPPYAGHPNDPRNDQFADDECEDVVSEFAITEAARQIARDEDRLNELQSGSLNYALIYVKVAGQQRDLFRAYDLARIRIAEGDIDGATCILNDITAALEAGLRDGLRTGRLEWPE